jgi:uncharacterized hydrophobic protein (TIGR00271 family)
MSMQLFGNMAINQLRRRAAIVLRKRFSLRADKASDAVIDQTLRAGVEMRGSNLWVLILAIFIASIGLNVNSTAVIIGAMLISPLMGPIMGVGYGVGISDFALVRTSLKNLGIATLLALITSTAYFAISPLTTVHSELLARTSPSIWDVLIAFLGGLAGIVATTRKEKSTVIPGVAIATALMPPLCTAGFGLATGNWPFFFGAFYLFTINSVFIALSAALVIRAYHVPQKQFVNERAATRAHLYLGMVGVLTVLPSVYLAYQLVGEEIFRSRATQFVQEKLELKQSHVVATHIDPKTRRIEVTLVGDVLSESALVAVASSLPAAGLPQSELKVFQTGEQRLDVVALKSDLLGDLYKDSRLEIEKKDKTVAQLQTEITSLKEMQQRLAGIPAELHTLYPQVWNVVLQEAPQWSAKTGWGDKNTVVLTLRSSKPLNRTDQLKIKRWAGIRLKTESVRLIVEVIKE